MALIYLVRHASPVIQPSVPSPAWPLSERGVAEAEALARRAAAWSLRAVYTSVEQKARSTALILAGPQALLSPSVVDGLEELRIDEWRDNADDFSELVRRVLEDPEASFRGAERAATAAERFDGAMRLVADGAAPAAVVSHGRVMTAWLASVGAIDDPFAFWRSIPMPAWASVEVAGARIKLRTPFVP